MSRILIKLWVAIIAAVLLFSAGTSAYGQQPPDDQKKKDGPFKEVERRYDNEEFETAYDLFKIIEEGQLETIQRSPVNYRAYLDLGIRLSFLSEDWEKLDQYIKDYHKIDSNFSIDRLSDKQSDQLNRYIKNILSQKRADLVYVNKHPQDIDLAPATITVYKQDDIQRLGARDLLDLLRMTTGFAELGDNNERVFGTRGSSNTTVQDVLFLINGHRLTDVLTNTNAPDWISLDYVEQIEIVKGPGSALYGGSAFSGVVNIITKDATKNINQFTVNLGNGNNFRSGDNYAVRLNYQTSKTFNNKELLYVSASYHQSTGNERSLANLQNKAARPDFVEGSTTDTLRAPAFTGTEFLNEYKPSYNFLATYNTERLSLTANAQSSHFVDNRPGSFNLWESHSDSAQLTRGRVDSRQFVHVEYDLPSNFLLKVSGDHFRKILNITPISTDTVGVSRYSVLRGDEFRATFNLDYINRKEDNYNILLGVEGFVNNWFYQYFKEQGDTLKLQKVGDHFIDSTDNGGRNEFIGAFYAQGEKYLIPEKLVLTLGLRFNYHNKFSRLDRFVWGESFSPRLAFIYQPVRTDEGLEPLKFKLIYNSAFLPPPFLYRRGGVDFFSASEELKSQIIESGEFVIYGEINKNLSYSALTYVNKIDNNIVRDGTAFKNQDTEIRRSGYELELKYKKEGDVSWYGLASFATTREDSAVVEQNSYFKVFDSNAFNAADSLLLFPRSQLKLALNVAIDLGESKRNTDKVKDRNSVSFGVNTQLIGETRLNNIFSFDDNGEPVSTSTLNTIPSAFVVNALARVKIGSTSIGLSAYNLFDTEYFLPSAVSNLNRQFAEGRSVFLDFTYYLKN